jgi:hypothetical protein
MVKALKHKSQALDFFLEFKKLLERDGQTIQCVYTDRGELVSSGLFKQHYTQHRILIESTTTSNPIQNRGGERHGKTI